MEGIQNANGRPSTAEKHNKSVLPFTDVGTIRQSDHQFPHNISQQEEWLHFSLQQVEAQQAHIESQSASLGGTHIPQQDLFLHPAGFSSQQGPICGTHDPYFMRNPTYYQMPQFQPGFPSPISHFPDSHQGHSMTSQMMPESYQLGKQHGPTE